MLNLCFASLSKSASVASRPWRLYGTKHYTDMKEIICTPPVGFDPRRRDAKIRALTAWTLGHLNSKFHCCRHMPEKYLKVKFYNLDTIIKHILVIHIYSPVKSVTELDFSCYICSEIYRYIEGTQQN